MYMYASYFERGRRGGAWIGQALAVVSDRGGVRQGGREAGREAAVPEVVSAAGEAVVVVVVPIVEVERVAEGVVPEVDGGAAGVVMVMAPRGNPIHQVLPPEPDRR